MNIENKHTDKESNRLQENFVIQITNSMLYDRLHTLSAEYSIPVDTLVNAAVKRMVNDVDFVRSLRSGKIE